MTQLFGWLKMRSYVDINAIPGQVSALVDANIFIYHLAGLSPDCTSFLRRVARSELDSHVTTVVIAEVLHRRMIGEAVAKGLVSPSQALKKLKANPSLVTQLTDYITDVQTVLRLPLKFVFGRQPRSAAARRISDT